MSKSWGLTVLRVSVGIVFLMHGWQKLFVFGIPGTTGFLAHAGIPLPHLSAIVVSLVEFLGGAALVLGAFTRVAAVLLAIDMTVAVLKVHLKNGFFLPTGFEFAFSMWAASICLALTGGGAASVDAAMGKKDAA